MRATQTAAANSPNPELFGGCSPACPGRQCDGGCLAEVVRERGEIPAFEIDSEGYWCCVDREGDH